MFYFWLRLQVIGCIIFLKRGGNMEITVKQVSCIFCIKAVTIANGLGAAEK